MTKESFIKLIGMYKGKALEALDDEVKATAISMIPSDVMEQLAVLQRLHQDLSESWEIVSRSTANTPAGTALHTYDKYYTSLIFGTKIEVRRYKEIAIQMAMKPLCVTGQYRNRRDMITKQFDEAIAKAKKLNSSKSLMELANLLDIPVGEDGVEIETKRTNMDVPFIKQQINQVKALA